MPVIFIDADVEWFGRCDLLNSRHVECLWPKGLAMKTKALPEDFYGDWRKIRSWCISFIWVFLEHAGKVETKDGWDDYRKALAQLPPLEWHKVERIHDDRMRFIVDAITSSIDEAADKKAALPGMFNGAVTGSKELLVVLERDLPLETLAKEVQRITDAM